jgi:hypothetical protein
VRMYDFHNLKFVGKTASARSQMQTSCCSPSRDTGEDSGPRTVSSGEGGDAFGGSSFSRRSLICATYDSQERRFSGLLSKSSSVARSAAAMRCGCVMGEGMGTVRGKRADRSATSDEDGSAIMLVGVV